MVTGVSRGLGHALALQLVADGHEVVGLSRTAVPSDGRRLRTIAGDVADPSAIDSIRELVGAEPVDLLVNNAAVGGSGRDLSPASLLEMRRALDVNLLGAATLTEALLPALRRAMESGSTIALRDWAPPDETTDSGTSS